MYCTSLEYEYIRTIPFLSQPVMCDTKENHVKKNGHTKSWGWKRFQDFVQPFFPCDLLTVSLDGLCKRGTTCNLVPSGLCV